MSTGFLKFFDTPFGHALSGVRVDGAAPRGLCWRLRRRFYKKGRGWRRGLCRRVVFASAQGATAPAALRVVVSPLRAMSIKSALRDLLSVAYGMISITSISHLQWLFPPLVPYGTTFPPLSGGTIKL